MRENGFFYEKRSNTEADRNEYRTIWIQESGYD